MKQITYFLISFMFACALLVLTGYRHNTNAGSPAAIAKTGNADYARDALLFRARRVALRASNGQYVCAEGGGGREVVANRNTKGGWETFTMIELGNNQVAFRAANGQYVCAEGGGGREVVANRNAIGSWETFYLIRFADGKIALWAANGQYVCAEGGGGREVVANRDAIGGWEMFTPEY